MAPRTWYRRRLPHYQTEGRTFLITFCTEDRWELPPVARDIAMHHILVEHRRKAFLYTFIVMPDHVHIVLSPLQNERGEFNAIADILHGIKGASGRRINKALGRQGAVWQHESHDHQIRSEDSLRAKCEYVAQNPVRAGLVSTPDEYPWLWRQWIDEAEPVEEVGVELAESESESERPPA